MPELTENMKYSTFLESVKNLVKDTMIVGIIYGGALKNHHRCIPEFQNYYAEQNLPSHYIKILGPMKMRMKSVCFVETY